MGTRTILGLGVWLAVAAVAVLLAVQGPSFRSESRPVVQRPIRPIDPVSAELKRALADAREAATPTYVPVPVTEVTITGIAVDERGELLEGASVVGFIRLGGSWREHVGGRLRSDGEGRFALNSRTMGVNRPAYRFVATHHFRRKPVEFVLSPDQPVDSVRLQFPAPDRGAIRLRSVVPEGMPVPRSSPRRSAKREPGVPALVWVRASERSPVAANARRFLPAAPGKWSEPITVEPGECRVHAHTDKTSVAFQADVAIGELVDREVSLQASAGLTGEVTGTHTGRRVPYVRLALHPHDCACDRSDHIVFPLFEPGVKPAPGVPVRKVLCLATGRVETVLYTGEDGAFAFPGLPNEAAVVELRYYGRNVGRRILGAVRPVTQLQLDDRPSLRLTLPADGKQLPVAMWIDGKAPAFPERPLSHWEYEREESTRPADLRGVSPGRYLVWVVDQVKRGAAEPRTGQLFEHEHRDGESRSRELELQEVGYARFMVRDAADLQPLHAALAVFLLGERPFARKGAHLTGEIEAELPLNTPVRARIEARGYKPVTLAVRPAKIGESDPVEVRLIPEK